MINDRSKKGNNESKSGVFPEGYLKKQSQLISVRRSEDNAKMKKRGLKKQSQFCRNGRNHLYCKGL